MGGAAAGWYANGPAWETYWDGTQWLDQHRQVASPDKIDTGPIHQPPTTTTATATTQSMEALVEPQPQPEAELFPFAASGVIIDIRPEGIHLEGTTWLGRGLVGDKPRVVPWDDISTLEVMTTGIRIREGRKAMLIGVPSKLTAQSPLVVERLAREFETATGRTLSTGKVTRAEKTAAVEDVFRRALSRKVEAIGTVIESGDHSAEVAMSHALLVWSKAQKIKGGVELATSELDKLRRSLGAHVPTVVGIVVSANFFPNLTVFDDRVHRGAEARPIDAFTQAQVFLDGQVQVTSRPSMTAGLLGSVLPGTALLPALAFGKKEKTDTRQAEFHVGSRDWTFSMSIPVQSVGSARSIAQRINAIADGMERDARSSQISSSPTVTPSMSDDADLTSQIERIVALERSGAITAEQATAMKARIIGL
ncbi:MULTISPECIES: DUF2510 domain-containing protein [Microbacterium]|uniref:DUF2510 domain-containing protein n=1 Tax=Microbacterium TaxID=33882 RepID=UPI0013B44C53|nr:MULTISPECIES: DUF2510 domain-containing protein [Microbacterium]MCZ0710781.1 DUF2510 domain-containing protein [Microbacterium paraoxydans]